MSAQKIESWTRWARARTPITPEGACPLNDAQRLKAKRDVCRLERWALRAPKRNAVPSWAAP
eukprot:560571-Pyramimonas_sp.AAC.1